MTRIPRLDTEVTRHELRRLNALQEVDAREYLRAAEARPVAHGACPACRPEVSQTLFDRMPVVICVVCDYVYIRGYPSAAVVKRSRGKQVTADDVMLYQTCRAEGIDKI